MRCAITAHRGDSRNYPENTLAAFRSAVELGVERIEYDLRRTRDGALVICHDATVDRTTDGTGSIWELTLAEIRDLNAGEGQQVPTFAEALAVCTPVNNLHVYPGPNDLEPIVDEVIAELHRQRRLDSVFISGATDVIERVAALEPGLTRCWLGEPATAADYPERSAARGCRNLQPWYGRCPLNRAFVDRAHALGLQVHPFYADDEARMMELMEYGVDGMLTNDPALLRQVRENRQG